jgi:FlaA1/EpsC-like NDP-sugar epimerase
MRDKEPGQGGPETLSQELLFRRLLVREILQGRMEVNRIRELQVEELLGREPIHLDRDEMNSFLAGKSVIVTGAGGSIGAELVRQVARFGPARLLLVERAEGALFNIHREIEEAWPELHLLPLLADVGDEARMRSIFAEHRPQVILHAAAHKHVPMMECNEVEAIKNNVLATHLLGRLAGEYAVDVFVFVSTDKAVRPSSVMGASKRVAELMVQDLNQSYERTQYVTVRFGNVIGSAGSVIPIFREQISRGGPVTVTHPEMERYFMTIPEAAQLVLQASTMGKGGEIFILDMGRPVRILDLAKEIIRLYGFQPDQEISIVFTGIRPGEKLTEELQIAEEQIETRHPKIFVNKIAGTYSKEQVRRALERLTTMAHAGQSKEIRCFLRDFLPESQLQVSAEPLDTETASRESGEFIMHAR